MTSHLVVLPGDGIGPEVIRAGLRVLNVIAARVDLPIRSTELLVGGAALDAYGTPLRNEDLDICRQADAVLLGAVGGPAWDTLPAAKRPERALLRLRSELAVGINLRPVQWTVASGSRSPVRTDIAEGTDIAFVRELTGGVYFGRPSFTRRSTAGRYAVDTARYTEGQIEDVLAFAFELAATRRGKVTSVDKANVMSTSRLWREVATEYGRRHPEIELEHALVDSFAMSLMQDPRRFDVVVTENLFGDILTDLASVLSGSLGLLPSASLRPKQQGSHFGLYEPVHGSAPTIAGQNIANPLGCILSMALMLEWTFERPDLGALLREAVNTVLAQGHQTADLVTPSTTPVSTDTMVDAIVAVIDKADLQVEGTGGNRGRHNLRHHVA